MTTKDITIGLKTGLGAGPVAVFVQVASQYESSVYVEYETKKVNAKSLMGMMSLGIATGETVKVSADGNDATEAVAAIEKYLCSEA
ncbi:MAG: HPr family phosphocarrier protein [Lachnospiraceae bacterium]|nr:HPr family phosphocarrier protein [Lachnospiraceae bacterium]